MAVGKTGMAVGKRSSVGKAITVRSISMALGGQMTGTGSLDGGGVTGSHGTVGVGDESVSTGRVDIGGVGSSQRAVVASVATVATVPGLGRGNGKESGESDLKSKCQHCKITTR
jgi:hypothetical protein